MNECYGDTCWGSCSTIIEDEMKNINSEEKPSMVNHPIHYNRKDAIECIDEMELVFGPEATSHFCLLNCWKYRYRAGLKNNGYEDLEKSDWYMRKYKELKEKIEKNSQGSFSYKIFDNQIQVVPCGNFEHRGQDTL